MTFLLGSGKTYLACGIANALTEDYQIGVKIRNFAQIINELQKAALTLRECDKKG